MVGAPRAARSRAAARVHSRRHRPDITSCSGAVCRKHLTPQTTAPLALCWQLAMFTAECCTASPLMHILPAYALLADALVHHCCRPCTFLCTQLHHTAAPPIADAYSCGHSCLHSCLLCSCLMVWSGTAVMAYDGAGTAGSKRQRKAAPRFVFDEYCRTVWRASEKFCLV